MIAGRITLTSSNLALWEARIPSSNTSHVDLQVHGKECITLGLDSGTDQQVLYASGDGLAWKTFKSDISSKEDIYSIVWDGQQYFGLNKFNRTLRSPDLKTWQPTYNNVSDGTTAEGLHTVYNDLNINKIIYDGKQHIAIADHGLILVNDNDMEDTATTMDWTIVRERAPLNFTNLLFDGKNRYVAAGSNFVSNTFINRGSLWESSNGYEWNKSEISVAPPFMSWSNLAAGNGTLIAHGYGNDLSGKSTDRSQYYYSTAPGVWETKKFPAGVETVFGISWVNQQFYAAVTKGYITSKDGVTWSNVKSAALTMETIVKGGNITLGIRASNENNQNGGGLYSSNDGTSWKKSSLKMDNPYWGSSDIMHNIVWNGKQFAIIGNNATVAVSPNGLTWKVKQTANRYMSSAWKGKLYMASAFGDGDDYGKMFYSYDGLNYSMSTQVTNHSMNTALIWDGKKFIVAGDNGTILIGKPSK